MNGQLELFATGEPERSGDAVEPAAVSRALESLAANLPRALYLGTSSWSFPTWQGLVYRCHIDSTPRPCRARRLRPTPVAAHRGHRRTFYAPIPVEAYAGYVSDGGARLCIGLHPRMPAAAEQGRLHAALPPGPLVVPWNLRSGLTYEDAKARYYPFDRLVDEDPATRAALTDLCRRALADAQRSSSPTTRRTNNKAEGSAPLTIVKLAETIAGAR